MDKDVLVEMDNPRTQRGTQRKNITYVAAHDAADAPAPATTTAGKARRRTHTHAAPDHKEPPPRASEETRNRNTLAADLAETFARLTGHMLPDWDRQRSEALNWKKHLLLVAGLVGDDPLLASYLVEVGVGHCLDEKLTIKGPSSIVGICRSTCAAWRRGELPVTDRFATPEEVRRNNRLADLINREGVSA